MTEPKSSWFHWRPTSLDHLKHYEVKMLSVVDTPHEVVNVDLGDGQFVNTLITKPLADDDDDGYSNDADKPILVMLHGFAGGIGLWNNNIDDLARHYRVYAIDLLGFGSSSRPKFPKTALEAEELFVDTLEAWREKLGITKFFLMGHSFGGYQAGAYCLRYPEHVEHLIFADPWGFPRANFEARKRRLKWWQRGVAAILHAFAPLALLRAFGPLGPSLLPRVRPDLGLKYHKSKSDDVFQYIYHLNAQDPSGELGFSAMHVGFGYAHLPFLERVHEIHPEVPMTFVYGEHSWMDSSSGPRTREIRADSYVNIHNIPQAGHHVYADNHILFNDTIARIIKEHEDRYNSKIGESIA